MAGFENKALKKDNNLIFVHPFFRSFTICLFMLSPIKRNELVDLLCVLFTPVQFPLSRTQYGGLVKGRRTSGGRQHWGGPKKEEKKLILCYSTLIRNDNTTIGMTKCQEVLFISLTLHPCLLSRSLSLPCRYYCSSK